MSNITNVWYDDCTFKTATCARCYDKLIKGTKILSVARNQGKFCSQSNYCGKCADKELASALEELTPIIKRIISIQEEFDNDKKRITQVEDCFKEATEKFGTTLQKLTDH